MSVDQDFVIDSILTEYNGPGGDVTIPDGITRIGKCAFQSCKGLTSVTIPASVREIGVTAFLACPKLVIRTAAGSIAEEYAREHGIPFEIVAE